MRLHSIEISGFGPFGDTQRVDFDRLGRQGLFLLSGPTGAGKTSVLDAICFALYGDVPGARSGEGLGLVSHHRDPDSRPEVRLEFTAQARRFRIARVPQHNRPKKRGEGETEEPASAVLEELVGGEWLPRSSRIKEVADEIAGVIGMDKDQFSQVVMLPQGEFARFLRAEAKARREVLERLFPNRDFAYVERWLKERAAQAGRARDEGRVGISERIVGAARLAGIEFAEAPDPRDEALAAEAGEPESIAEEIAAVEEAGGGPMELMRGDVAQRRVRSRPAPQDAEAVMDWVAAVGEVLDARLAGAKAQHEAAAEEVAAAQRELEAGRRLAERLRARRQARSRLEGFESRSTEQEERRRRIEAATDAAAVRPMLGSVRAARERAGAAAKRRDRLAREADRLGVAAGDGAEPAEASLRAEAARLEAFEAGPLAERVEVEAEAEGLAEAIERNEAKLRSTQVVLEKGPPERRRVAGELERAKLAAARVEAAQRELEGASAKAGAAAERDGLGERLAEAEREAVAAQAEVNGRERRWLDLRRARLDGMAAELAAKLAEGESCPVCGSTEHPAPAQPALSLGLISDEDEKEAEEALGTARRGLELAVSRRDEAKAAWERLDERAGGGSAGELAAAETALRTEVEELVAVAGSLEELNERLTQLDDGIARATEARGELGGELAGDRRRLTELRERLEAVSREEERLRGDDQSVAARRLRLEQGADLLARLTEAAAEASRCETALAEAERELAELARRHGFSGAQEAERASLAPERLNELRHQASEFERDLAACRSRLAEPDLAGLEGLAAPELGALEARAAEAAAREKEHAGSLTTARNARNGFEREAGPLPGLLERQAPLERAAQTASQLADLVNGRGDNRLRMQLSTYVLAARLQQVTEAANLHLEKMSGGRYRLIYEGGPAARGALGGLGIDVLDAHTGERRHTATLSGGESFYASLALALGLAEVVQREAAGRPLETLFIDEGFGTLDNDTLEVVMAELDELRDRGRVVGVVSHVEELKQRIATQLVVDKSNTGSALRVVAA